MVEEDKNPLDHSKDEAKIMEKLDLKLKKTSRVESDLEDNSYYGEEVMGEQPQIC